MNKHFWEGDRKSPDQVRRENLDSDIFSDREAVKDVQAERADRKLAAAAVRLTPEEQRASAERHVREVEYSHLHGAPLLFSESREALVTLREITRYGFAVSAEFVARLRLISGIADRQDLAPPAPEPYAEYAMGMHD